MVTIRGDGSTTERGYGSEHQKLRARWSAIVERGQVNCARCGRWIAPGTPWDLGHDDIDRHTYTGPEHASCNRATSAHRAQRRRLGGHTLPSWWPRG